MDDRAVHPDATTPRADAGAQRRPSPIWFGAAIVLLLVAFAPQIDRTTYHALAIEDPERHDWYWLLRLVGDVRTWVVVAVAFFLLDRGRPAPLRRALLVVCAPALAGLIAEVAKLVFRRMRPEAADGHYLFRAFTDDTLSSSGLGFPSSHTAVAFGAAFMLSYLHPRAWPLWIALATGCGVSRMLAGAHFLTDVLGGVLVGWVALALLRKTDRDRPSGEGASA